MMWNEKPFLYLHILLYYLYLGLHILQTYRCHCVTLQFDVYRAILGRILFRNKKNWTTLTVVTNVRTNYLSSVNAVVYRIDIDITTASPILLNSMLMSLNAC